MLVQGKDLKVGDIILDGYGWKSEITDIWTGDYGTLMMTTLGIEFRNKSLDIIHRKNDYFVTDRA